MLKMKELFQSLKKFSILDSIKHISMTYNEIRKSLLHACWKSLWPDIINGENNSVALEEEYSRIIELGQELGAEGFDDITQADIKELMPDQQLNADDLIEMFISCE